jgi:hypothetical protein
VYRTASAVFCEKTGELTANKRTAAKKVGLIVLNDSKKDIYPILSEKKAYQVEIIGWRCCRLSR